MNTYDFNDFDEQGQLQLKGTKLISFDHFKRSILGDDPFANIRTDKSFEDISNEYAISSPLKKGSLFYKTIDAVETLRDSKDLEIKIRVAVEDDINVIRASYKKEVVNDNIIKLYIVVHDETLITKGKQTDIRSAGIRVSNITEITGVVLGDRVFELFDEYPEKIEKYVIKLANDLINSSSQLDSIKDILREKFEYYMENKRNALFPMPKVGQMLQKELKISLQEFWKPVLTSLANEIKSLKLEDEAYWQPYTPQGQLKTSKDFRPLIGQGVSNVERYSKTFLDTFNTIDFVMQDFLDLKLIESAKKLNKPEHRSQLKLALAKIYELFTDVLGFFKDVILGIIKKLANKAYELNAFLVGLYNGLINFIASIPELIGFLSGLLSGDGYELWQAVKKEFKNLQEKGAFLYLFEAIGKFFDSISKRYDMSQSKYLIIKNLGEDCVGLLELVFGIFKAGKALVSLGKKTFDAFKKKVDDIFKVRKNEFDGISPDNIKGTGLYGGKILSKKEIAVWEKRLLKKFGTKLEKVDGFDSPDVQAQFDANTNTIKYKDDTTEYFMGHESFHAEEMYKIGFDEYVKDAALQGTKFPKEYTDLNLIRSYKREKYVHDRIKQEAKVLKLNQEELNNNRIHLDYFYTFQLELRKIDVSKIETTKL